MSGVESERTVPEKKKKKRKFVHLWIISMVQLGSFLTQEKEMFKKAWSACKVVVLLALLVLIRCRCRAINFASMVTWRHTSPFHNASSTSPTATAGVIWVLHTYCKVVAKLRSFVSLLNFGLYTLTIQALHLLCWQWRELVSKSRIPVFYLWWSFSLFSLPLGLIHQWC